ncbi:MAG: sugar ABC transporter permease [Clostridia bacterium]|nr:sugar ABC transporter permease [Clostridia bacterium]
MEDRNRPILKHPAWWLLATPMVVPALLVVAALAVMAYYSFTRFNVVSPAVFVGLQNYAQLFANSVHWTAVGNTVLYLLLGGGVSIALGWLCGTGAARLPQFLRPILLALFGVGTLLSLCQQSWMNYMFDKDAYGLLNALLLQHTGQVADVPAVGGLITEPIPWAAMYPTAIRLLQLILVGVGPAFFIFYVGGRTGRSRAAWHTAVAAVPMWLVLRWNITVTVTGTPTADYKGLWLPEYLNDYLNTRFDIGYGAAILMHLILLLAVLVGVAQVVVWLCTRHSRTATVPDRPGTLAWCGGGVGLMIGALVAVLLVLVINGALKPMDEWLLFPPRFFAQRPTLDNFSFENYWSQPNGFLHLLPIYWLVSVVYYCTAILPPAVFFAFSGSRLRRPVLLLWLAVMALAPLARHSILWWEWGLVNALGPVLRLCCHFSPLYPACLLLTVLILRRVATGCHGFSDLFRSTRRIFCSIAGVLGCCALFPLSMLLEQNGLGLIYDSRNYFPLQLLGVLSGGVAFAGTLTIVLVGLALLLAGLTGMTAALHSRTEIRRVGKE